MEVLRATEILEKEINENAKKKAEQVLAEAKLECKRIAEEADKRIAAAEREENEVLNKRLDAVRMRVDAAVPLEKGRILASYTTGAVVSAVNEYINALGDEKQLELILKVLERYKPVMADRKFVARVIGFDCKPVQTALPKVFSGGSVVSCEPMETKDAVNSGILSADGTNLQKGVILECEDGSVRCRATFEDIVSNLKEFNGEELVKTLFSGGLPQ